jgi:nucleotide-binding universal stress UspA family protein
MGSSARFLSSSQGISRTEASMFRSILLHLNGSKRDTDTLGFALALAADHGAEVTALCTITPFHLSRITMGDALAGSITLLKRGYLAKAADQADALRARVEQAAKAASVRLEWRLVEDYPDHAVALHARYADLAIVARAQSEPGGNLVSSVRPSQLLLGAGRPILVCPSHGPRNRPPQNALIAWNDSREAARAVHDALPILTRASRVTLASIDAPDGRPIATVEISAHLAHHGCMVEVSRHIAEQPSAGRVLLALARECAADVLIMGAYGHSRLQEQILGGATHDVLSEAPIPIFASH